MPDRSAVRLAFAVLLAAVPVVAQATVRTFAIRVGGRTIGGVTETEELATEDGRQVLKFTSRTEARAELLGMPIDQVVEQTWWLDPTSRAVLRMQSSARTGNQEVAMAGRLVDGRFRIEGGEALDPAAVVITPESRWLVQRGPKQPGERVEVDALMPELGSVQKLVVVLPEGADREIDVLGKKTPVRVYEVGVLALGLESKVFVTADGELMRYEMPAQDTVVERTAAAAEASTERLDLSDLILVRTNLELPDSTPLTYVRLRATIETAKAVTAAALNVRDQTFEGTVKDGRVEGVFEIRSRRSDGSGSPPYPVPEGTFAAEWLAPWLAPEPNKIESDDAAIAAKARELAAGSATCFEVVERLARWCHDEIPYAIPGGGSAKGTFEQKAGECGGHSRLLAAMLRSLGIPARTPMGGMHVPLQGGSFGQHMWNEVWLGDALGWLPVDCTAGQPTFVDASHIRLADGEVTFRPLAVEVLDHEPKAAVADDASAVRRADAFPFLAGAPMVYVWSKQGQRIGDERVTYVATPDGGHVFESSLKLAGFSLEEVTRTEVGDDGRLYGFHAERTVGPQQFEFEVERTDGTAVCVRRAAGEERSDDVAVDPASFVLHNNCTPHFMVPLSRYWPLPDGVEVRLRMLHVEQRTVLPATLRGAGAEAITIGGRQVTARAVECQIAGLRITLHADDDGRLLRFHQQQGDVTIELQPQ